MAQSEKDRLFQEHQAKIDQQRWEARARHEDPKGLHHKNNRNPGINVSRRTYTAVKGDSLYAIARKTVPAGKDVNSWFQALKKVNSVNGKLRRIYVGTGISMPGKSRPVSTNRMGR